MIVCRAMNLQFYVVRIIAYECFRKKLLFELILPPFHWPVSYHCRSSAVEH